MVGGLDTRAVFPCLPKHMGGELGLKQSSWDLNLHYHIECSDTSVIVGSVIHCTLMPASERNFFFIINFLKLLLNEKFLLIHLSGI